MCGRFNLTDSPVVQTLMASIGMPIFKVDALRFSTDIAPGSTISIVRQRGTQLELADALWWLMLDQSTLKPDYRYASFNTRSDKLQDPRSLGYWPYRKSRCIIPASAFIEGAGDKKTYHKIHFEGHAIAFGGLYREWVHKETGELARSASIITLPPVPEWSHIHPKSLPLMLPDDQELRQAWLSPDLRDVTQLDHLLEPKLYEPHWATPIGKVSAWNEIGEAYLIRPGAMVQATGGKSE